MPLNEAFSVLIPERARPDLLGATLEALKAALEGLDAPYEVIVLVNGVRRRKHYDGLRRAFPWVEWHFAMRALGFHGAMERLLAHARHPWVYLLNSDMRLHPDALRELLPWRAADVFAIASQIHFADSARRREETGFTQAVVDERGGLHLHDVPPLDEGVRAHLYAGGGASLFQAAPLRRYFQRSHAYAPFYFEDADWAMQAWAEGLNVLFCPRSQALHEHRATIARYYPQEVIERIVGRNLRHFRWRYADCFGAKREDEAAAGVCERTLRDFSPAHRQARAAVLDSPLRPDFHRLTWKRFPHPGRYRPGNPRVLLVSPFAVIPPAHGGARRVLELARASAESVDWILLHDEAGAATAASVPLDGPFREIHPIGGRPPHGDGPLDRLRAHAHPSLVREMLRLLRQSRAQMVCLEHIESLCLIDALPPAVPVVLTLHDAGRHLPEAVAGELRARLPRIAALVLSTPQDLGFWGHPNEMVIENGVHLPAMAEPSPDCLELLSVAPLRYDRNRSGLRRFLEDAWPRLRGHIPQARLTILGGQRAGEYLHELPESPGVEVVDGFVDPAPYYARCAVAINPQMDIEGSALKVAEALAHGRVMVSTHDGARGYEALASLALFRAEDCAAMVPYLVDLLANPGQRHARERQARADIQPWSWEHGSAKLLARIRQIIPPS